MKIGIIGIGNIGGTIARKLKAAGHEIRVANSRGRESVRRFAGEIGATAADVNGAVAGVDVIFLSIPLPAMAELPKGAAQGGSGRCSSRRYQQLLSWNARPADLGDRRRNA